MEPLSRTDTPVLQVVIAVSGFPVIAAATFMLLVSTVAMRLLFHPLRRETVISHGPLTLETVPALSVWLLNGLPMFFPRAFATIIGHSIYDYDPNLNGTWLAERWSGPLTFGAAILFAIGFPWAIGNMAFGRAIRSNLLALAIFLLWSILAFLGFTGHFSGYL